MRILIIEDERKMAAVIKKGLAENHCVSLAFDGRSGLELALSWEFDVLVLDLMLPGIDRFEVARRLRRNDNRNPYPDAHSSRCRAGHRQRTGCRG